MVLTWLIAASTLAACGVSQTAGLAETNQYANTGGPVHTGNVTAPPTADPNQSITDPNTAPSTAPTSNPDITLAMVHPTTVPTGSAGINLSPRVALNECLDISYGKPASALPLELYWCVGYPQAQSWQYVGGQLRIDDGWCLDVSSADPTRATNAILNRCDTSGARPGQFWNFVEGKVQVAGTGICLKVPDVQASIQKNMVVGPCNDTDPLQQWAIDQNTPSGTIGVKISNQAASTKCLDVYAQHKTPGAAVDIWACNGSDAQQWVWQSMQLQAETQCLQASANTVSMQPCDPANANQHWVTDHGRLKLDQGFSCLDLSNNLTDDGSALAMTACSSAASQQWVWGGP